MFYKGGKNMESINIKEILGAVDGILLLGDENIQIRGVKTNSKEEIEQSLFVPIVGERVDAHNFIMDAKQHGSVACFVSHEVELIDGLTYIKVEDTLVALQRLGSYYRDKFNIPVIGITGSVGKTTTKEMVSAALETKYKVLKTIGNMNSQVGLPLMMFHMEKEHEIAVIEMGISEFGEMERLSRISKPTTAILTNIGVSHIAQLKSRENIRKEKIRITDTFDKNSVLYICGDDDLLSELHQVTSSINNQEDALTNKISNEINKSVTSDTENSYIYDTIDLEDITKDKIRDSKVIAFGLSGGCEYQAKDIRVENGKTYFTVNDELVVLNVLGNHNVSNALVALAVANQYGIPIHVAKKGLESYLPIAMRGQIKESNGVIFIDDSYNASPDSMKSGINVLLSLENVTRRIAVLADVRELGEVSKESHYGIGRYIATRSVDFVITIGTEAKFIAQGIKDNTDKIETISFDNNQQAISYLRTFFNVGDGVLVKGSRGMATEVIIKEFCNE